MKKAFTSLLFSLFLFFHVLGQSNCERNNCNWKYFSLNSLISGQLISYELMTNNYGHRPTVSIAIVKVNADTFRILSSCTQNVYKIGSEINIFPSEGYSDYSYPRWVVGIPINRTKGWKKRKQEQIDNLPSRFDKVILKTTWGELSKENECDRSLLKKINGNSYQCQWTYFKFEKPIEGEIIKFEKQTQPCKIFTHGSVAIVKTKVDTLRIIDCCHEIDFKIGQKVKILPSSKPSSLVNIPYIEKVKNGLSLKEVNEYDLLVKRTTWGKLENASR